MWNREGSGSFSARTMRSLYNVLLFDGMMRDGTFTIAFDLYICT